MATKYAYSISNDFPNNLVASSELASEIQISTITGTLSHINTDSDICDIWFDASLVSAEQITLSGVVSAHGGQYPSSEYKVTAGEDVGARKGIYISGSNEIKLARADSENTLPCVGFTESTAASGANAIIWTNDLLDGFSGLTPGAEYYLSQTNAGEITTTKPTTSGIIVSVGVAKTDTELDIHIIRVPPELIFGSEYNYAKSGGESSTTSTTWQQKLGLSIPTVPSGTYRAAFTAEIKKTGSGACECRLLVDGTERAFASDNAPAWNVRASFIHPVFAVPNTHELKIEWKATPGATAYIRRAKLEFWRIR